MTGRKESWCRVGGWRMYSSLSVVPSRTGNVFHGGGDMGNMDAEAERAKVQVDNVQKEMPDVQSEV